jgi:hypothetical protein
VAGRLEAAAVSQTDAGACAWPHDRRHVLRRLFVRARLEAIGGRNRGDRV